IPRQPAQPLFPLAQFAAALLVGLALAGGGKVDCATGHPDRRGYDIDCRLGEAAAKRGQRQKRKASETLIHAAILRHWGLIRNEPALCWWSALIGLLQHARAAHLAAAHSCDRAFRIAKDGDVAAARDRNAGILFHAKGNIARSADLDIGRFTLQAA